MYYPILSVLRRVCVSHTYVDSPNLHMSKKGLCLNENFKWESTDTPHFMELKCQEENPMLSSTQLCKAENEIFQKANLENVIYSLFFGPCSANTVRVAIVKGIWRKDLTERFISLKR